MMFHNAPYANELDYDRNACVTVADVASDACDLAADPPYPPPPGGGCCGSTLSSNL